VPDSVCLSVRATNTPSAVAGSPVGIEDAVVAGGPLYAIIGLVVMPFVWCIPEALVAAELATAFPEDAGFIAWVSEAFGETAGYVEGIMSWVAGVVDNAAYPVR
jgi:amino acid transporter